MADIIARAAEFARKAHYGQVRKWTNDPYFNPIWKAAYAVLVEAEKSLAAV